MADTIYDVMKRRIGIDLGQVFTPLHLAEFAAKLLDIKDGDVVIDTCAGSGSLLLTAAAHGAAKVYGIELDERVHGILENNLATVEVEHETLNCAADTDEAAAWMRAHDDVTKALLNPPYEAKYHTFEILMNTLDNLPKGTKVALIYPAEHLTKNGTEWQAAFMSKHRLEKVIKLPNNTFQPFASVQTALFIITAGVPQGDAHVFGCDIQTDGLTRKKNAYREDTRGTWKNKLEPYWLDVIERQDGDDSCSDIDPKKTGLRYYKEIDLRPTHDDFHRVVKDYLGWKAGQILQTLDPSLSNDDIGGTYSNISLLMTRCPNEFARLLFGDGGLDRARELAKQRELEKQKARAELGSPRWADGVEIVAQLADGTVVDIDEVDLSCHPEMSEVQVKAWLVAQAKKRGGRLVVPVLREPNWGYMEGVIENIELEILGEVAGM